VNKRLVAVINFTRFTLRIDTAEPSSSQMAALCTLLGGGGGGGERLRATSQIFVTGANVGKIEDHNHLNPNHEQRFTTCEELFFCF
jgi:hypothetical protein